MESGNTADDRQWRMRVLLSFAITIPSLLIARIALHYAISDSNHSAVDITCLIPLLVRLAAISAVGLMTARRMALCAMVLNLSAVGIVHSVDKHNLIVPYETWIDRGMPDSPLER